jgi:sulfate transport system permease protein
MTGMVSLTFDAAAPLGPPSRSSSTTEPAWVRWSLIGLVVAVLSVLLFAPLIVVFVEALTRGFAFALSRSPTETPRRRSG